MLNCFYKCISRAFAERLKKYMNKLTPCAQKGYANGRYCQEVLIGVIDTIETCKNRNTKGALLSLDIQKASILCLIPILKMSLNSLILVRTFPVG